MNNIFLRWETKADPQLVAIKYMLWNTRRTALKTKSNNKRQTRTNNFGTKIHTLKKPKPHIKKKNHLRNRGGSDVFKRFGFRGCGCGSMNVSDGYIKRCYNVWRYINLRKIQNSKPIKMNILMQFNNKKGKKLIRIPCSMKQKESICL